MNKKGKLKVVIVNPEAIERAKEVFTREALKAYEHWKLENEIADDNEA